IDLVSHDSQSNLRSEVQEADVPVVLVCSKALDHEGGVVNYYRQLLSEFTPTQYVFQHYTVGSRTALFYQAVLRLAIYPFFLAWDLIVFAVKIAMNRRIRLVIVNPSLAPVPLIRDGLVLLIAKLFGRRVIVFYRGWKEYVIPLLSKGVAGFLFRSVYSRADHSLVLADRFATDLRRLSIDSHPITTTRTFYKIRQKATREVVSLQGKPKLLYLGRLSSLKGVDELLVATKTLKDSDVDFRLVIAGHGETKEDLQNYREQVISLDIDDCVDLPGRVDGDLKQGLYDDADIFVFPSWGEGCPNSVVEALGAGLFVVGSDVGAIPEIVREGFSGRIVPIKNADLLAQAMSDSIAEIAAIRQLRGKIAANAKDTLEFGSICKQIDQVIIQNLKQAT
ncbi:MAG: glycosyltransferase family 4 protein, partial [Rubripirellula sp.]